MTSILANGITLVYAEAGDPDGPAARRRLIRQPFPQHIESSHWNQASKLVESFVRVFQASYPQGAMFTGRRSGAGEAVAAGILAVAAPSDRGLAGAIEQAVVLAGKPQQTAAAIKRATCAEAVAARHTSAPVDLPAIERAAATVRGMRAGAR
jgi:enoyl-CoA hydratase/carnithine racemase